MRYFWTALIAAAAALGPGCGREGSDRAAPSPTPAKKEAKTAIRDVKFTVIRPPAQSPRSVGASPEPIPSASPPPTSAMLEEYRRTLAEATEAIKADAKDAGAFRRRAEAKRELGDLSGSIRDYGRAIALNPKDPQLYLERARAGYRSGNVRIALNDSSRAIELDPNLAAAYALRARARGDNAEHREAAEDWSKVIECDPQNVEAYRLRGTARFALGDAEGACADWRLAKGMGDAESSELIRLHCW